MKIAGAAGAVAAPTVVGYNLLQTSRGEYPPALSPYDDQSRLAPAGADRPILLLVNDRTDNPFGYYLGEILCAEGLNCFYVARVSQADAAMLERFPLVLLAEGALDMDQAERLTGYVSGGGRLVAMRPDPLLLPVLGVEAAGGSSMDGYLFAARDHALGRGLRPVPLQFHGTASHFRLATAQAVAWLTDRAGQHADYPAVALNRFGNGQAAMWAFDLARNVALTRQGNPAWANTERDGAEGIRAHDAFVGWVDLDRLAIPQADEHMRLLSRLASEMLSDLMPLPRLWYFPGSAEAMFIATGDSHQNPAPAIEDVLTRVDRRGGHMTVYYTPPLSRDWRRAARQAEGWVTGLPLVKEVLPAPSGVPSASLINGWRARGHEFALHPYVEAGLEAGWHRYWQEYTGLGFGPMPPTVRTHRVLWQGWVETARVQASYGLGMNLDYYHVGPSFQNEAGEWVYGHFTGSGLPMKFVDAQGRILDIYQQLTQLVDEHLLDAMRVWGAAGWAHLGADEAVAVSRSLLRGSLEGAPAAIAAQFHVDSFAVGGSAASEAGRWLEGTLDEAVALGIPIWSAADWYYFTDARHDTVLEDFQWSAAARRLTLRLEAPASGADLSLMFPLQQGIARLEHVEVDGAGVEYRERTLSGTAYGWITVPRGGRHVSAAYAG